jgi:hypothetical protein
MDICPASLGFDPTFELEDCLFEVGDRGFHLGNAAARVANARLVQAVEPRGASPITVLACFTLGRRCIDQLRFVLESFHLRTPLLLVGLRLIEQQKYGQPAKRAAIARDIDD